MLHKSSLFFCGLALGSCVMALAQRPEQQRPRLILESCNIPFPVLAKTLQVLAKARLIHSQHGSIGGYVPARPSNAISALDVIRSCAASYNLPASANRIGVSDAIGTIQGVAA